LPLHVEKHGARACYSCFAYYVILWEYFYYNNCKWVVVGGSQLAILSMCCSGSSEVC